MKKNIVYYFVILSIYGCNTNANLPKACFSTSNDLRSLDSIQFTNCSENATHYLWDFGDSIYSSDTEPKHLFKRSFSHTVTLIASNDEFSTSVSKVVNFANGKVKSDFEYSPADFIAYSINFINYSDNSTSYKWDFGDGTTSIEKSPTHIYNTSGTYTVKLVASNENKSDYLVKTISVYDIVGLNNQFVPNYSPVALDIDGDNVNDLQIYTDSYDGVSTHYSYSYITPLNNYEIAIDSIIQKTWSIYPPNYTDTTYNQVTRIYPKIYVLGNQILNFNNFSNKKISIAIRDLNYWGYGSSIYLNTWIKDEIRYIGLRKVVGNTTKIGWIKLKVLGYSHIILYSFKIPTETKSLLIDK
jgi:PKD repeat protein